MNSPTYFGRCYCGTVRFSITGPVRNLCVCHCESCRRAAGAAFVGWGTVDTDGFRIIDGEPAAIKLSPEVERTFCNQCGSSLTYRHALRPGEVDFTLVSLNDPAALAPRMHIWVQDKLPWVTLNDGLPQFQTVSGQGNT
jgi:hypothetical protein